MRKVTVKRMFQNEIDEEYPDKGVFYDEHGVVISCDPYGLIEILAATPIEGTDAVVIEEKAENLNSDELLISLILSGGMNQ